MESFTPSFVRSGDDPYVIAEIGVNHEGDIEVAKSLIDSAARGGASCAKFQTYKAATIVRPDSPAYWDTTEEPTESQYELFRKFDLLSRQDYEELALYCARVGIDFSSTPFNLEAVGWLAPLMPFIKIASADITNVPLLREAASHGKPIILSSGASNLWEIAQAIAELNNHGAQEIVVMHCVLNYPTEPQNANLAMIRSIKTSFPAVGIGYSDHTKADSELTALGIAHSLGASVLEKHFTLDKTKKGNDHYHSMDEEDLKSFLLRVAVRKQYLGEAQVKTALESEKPARLHARRSVVTSRSIEKGEVFTGSNLICLRPGDGISPLMWDEIIGKIASVDIEPGTKLNWGMIAE